MSGFSWQASAKLLDWFVRGQAAPTLPSSLYLALYTGSREDDSGLGLTEVTGGSYARVEVPRTLSAWTDATGSNTGAPSAAPYTSEPAVLNVSTLTFPAPTADWGVVTCMGFASASTAGEVWAWIDLPSAVAVLNGDPAPRVAALTMQGTID